MRGARADAEDAADDLEVAKEALAMFEGARGECDDGLRRAERRVAQAIEPIMAGEIDRLISEAEALRGALEGKRAILACLGHWFDLGAPERLKLRLALGDASWPGLNHPAAEPWRRAREALGRDADVSLPR